MHFISKRWFVVFVLVFCLFISQRIHAQDSCAPASGGVEVLNAPGVNKNILSNTFQLATPGVTIPWGWGSSFRIAKNWVLTAAHGFDNITNKDGPVNVAIDRKQNFQKVHGENDYIIRVAPVSRERPANGFLYFVGGSWAGQGAIRNLKFYGPNGERMSGPWWTYNPAKHNIDFALLRIDDIPGQSVGIQCFLKEPVKDFEILIIPRHEDSHALAVSPVQAFYFDDPNPGKLAEIFNNKYWGYTPDYGVIFKGDGIIPGTSGSAIAQNNMIVGIVSTSDHYWLGEKGKMVGSQFFDLTFKNFIKNTLGKDAAGIRFVEPRFEPISVKKGRR